MRLSSAAASWRSALGLGLFCLMTLLGNSPAAAESPPQRLPSAVLIYPLIDVDGCQPRHARRAAQPDGAAGRRCTASTSSAAPATSVGLPRSPDAEPAVVVAGEPGDGQQHVALRRAAVLRSAASSSASCNRASRAVDAHNAIQGRAVVFGVDGQTLGYGAVAFRRLADGDVRRTRSSSTGRTYAQCPDEQHFVFLASDPSPAIGERDGDRRRAREDLENQVPTVDDRAVPGVQRVRAAALRVDQRHLLQRAGCCARSAACSPARRSAATPDT